MRTIIIFILATILSGVLLQAQEPNREWVVGGHSFVDLRLPSGTLWATCNIGAEEPTDFGDYFAWGEIATKDWYDRTTYEFYDSEEGWLSIGNYISGTEYDAATQIWGEEWHTPTCEEFKELYEYCNRGACISIDGVYMFKFIGPNRKYIILPIGGLRYEDFVDFVNKETVYWTSSYIEEESSEKPDRVACGFLLQSYASSSIFYDAGREYGRNIRPVTNRRDATGIDKAVINRVDEKIGVALSGKSLTVKNPGDNCKVEIYDYTGHEVFSKYLVEPTISMEGFLPGIYIIKASNGSNTPVCKKIILK